MSHWKAFAQARDERGDLFERHVAALEALYTIAAFLRDDTDGPLILPTEEAILGAIEELKRDVQDARIAENEADEERRNAEAAEKRMGARLDKLLSANGVASAVSAEASSAMQEELAATRSANDVLCAELARLTEVVDAHGAAFIAARRFIAATERAGKAVHVRRVKPR